MGANLSDESLLAEQAALQNIVPGITITATTISVRLEPRLAARYVRADCRDPVGGAALRS
jgi:hypothetical protein